MTMSITKLLGICFVASTGMFISKADAFMADAKCYVTCTAKKCAADPKFYENCKKNCKPGSLKNCMAAAKKAGFEEVGPGIKNQKPDIDHALADGMDECLVNLNDSKTILKKLHKAGDAARKKKIEGILSKVEDVEKSGEMIRRNVLAGRGDPAKVQAFIGICKSLRENVEHLSKM